MESAGGYLPQEAVGEVVRAVRREVRRETVDAGLVPTDEIELLAYISRIYGSFTTG